MGCRGMGIVARMGLLNQNSVAKHLRIVSHPEYRLRVFTQLASLQLRKLTSVAELIAISSAIAALMKIHVTATSISLVNTYR